MNHTPNNSPKNTEELRKKPKQNRDAKHIYNTFKTIRNRAYQRLNRIKHTIITPIIPIAI